MFTNVYLKKLSGLYSIAFRELRVFRAPRTFRVFLLLCLFFIGALTACDGAKTVLTEEFAILPDSKDSLVSEFSRQGVEEGRIALLNSVTGQRSTLYSSHSSNDLKVRPVLWGDFACDEPEQFSPQGFDLAQRPSGRWQLLVVNHGSIETVEMFELQKNSRDQWELLWRGCVEMPSQDSFDDVKALSNGFVLKRTPSLQLTLSRWVKNILGRNANAQWRWRLRDGFQPLVITDEY